MKFRIFLSSPGDCAEERAATHEIARRLNADPIVTSFAHVEVIAWDWGAGVPLDALSSPQTSVNNCLPLPEACDVFVGIFRCRFGTPLPVDELGKKRDGTPFLSGSEYEFHRAWDARRRGAAKPEMLVYRLQQTEDRACLETEQYEKLQAFFSQPPFQDTQQWIGSVNWYSNPQDFAEKLDGHLRRLLSQRQTGADLSIADWLKRQADLLSANAGPRYTRSAHLETDITQVFDWLMARQPAITALDKALTDVWKEIERDATFEEVKQDMERIAETLRNDIHWQSTPDFAFILDTAERIRSLAWDESKNHKDTDEETRKGDNWRYRDHRLHQAALYARNAAETLKRFAPLASKRILLLTGPAGQGKTHTLIHEINRTLEMGGLAVGVLGQMLSAADDLWTAIRNRLEWRGSTSQLLDKLENEAASRGQRALIVIDALNETPERKRWRQELPGMVREILQRPHLTLAFSVRSDYLRQVLPEFAEGEAIPWVQEQHPGFAGVEPDALLGYFEFYGVKAPVAPPLGEFSNPLYVQLLAKSLKDKPLDHWLPSWLEVWQAWMERLEKDARDALGLDDPSRPNAMRRTMNKMAQSMLDAGGFVLPRPQAEEIACQATGKAEVIGFLCSAGALIDRLDGEEEEIVEFGFERLSDTFLADRLLAKLFQGHASQEEKREILSAALASGGSLHPLASFEWSEHPLCYRRTGLLEALCLAVPRYTSVEFPTLLPQEPDETDWQLADAFNDSLRWRSKPDEFGADAKTLFALRRKLSQRQTPEAELDELIRFALIPGHPFAMGRVIHPRLLEQDSPGARDALWSVHLVPLWLDEHSNLRQLVLWACDARLQGVAMEIALPAARVLAWACATSQNELRQAAMKGLTRLLVACPAILGDFLPDFLGVNDPYILEAVLVAVWGVVLDGGSPHAAEQAARRVYESQFPDGNARFCHIALRHYARRIVEDANGRGWLADVDLCVVQPPYRSTLPLDQVPDKKRLEALDNSHGYHRIVSSSTNWDFYRYIMGGNSASIDFSSQPLPCSSEPPRPFGRSENLISQHSNEAVFDLALAACFVAWNCRLLGWTAERFEEFDTGYYTQEHGRYSPDGRTERIGKKYQWISWHTLLGFLADNYAMRPDWGDEQRQYDDPAQIHEQLHDPARWLQVVASAKQREKSDGFWRIPSLPAWPQPDLADMRRWIESRSHDLPPTDPIVCTPDLPKDWGAGPWLRLAYEHIWESRFAPGQWGLGNDFFTNIWWQVWPMLIHAGDLPNLLKHLEKSRVRKHLLAIGRVDSISGRQIPLAQWPTLVAEWDEGFCQNKPEWREAWLPVPWRPLVGECGHPDRRDEHAPMLVPMPSLFREWNLDLDLHHGLVRCRNEPLFGLAGWIHGEDALFVRLAPLQTLLAASGNALVWWLRGERRAFLNIGNPNRDDSVWADYHGIAYLHSDGQVQTAWIHKEVRH